jgi:hypothetical protein
MGGSRCVIPCKRRYIPVGSIPPLRAPKTGSVGVPPGMGKWAEGIICSYINIRVHQDLWGAAHFVPRTTRRSPTCCRRASVPLDDNVSCQCCKAPWNMGGHSDRRSVAGMYLSLAHTRGIPVRECSLPCEAAGSPAGRVTFATPLALSSSTVSGFSFALPAFTVLLLFTGLTGHGRPHLLAAVILWLGGLVYWSRVP